MGRPRKNQSTFSTFSDSQEPEEVNEKLSSEDPQAKKKPLKKLKAEHLERKKIKEAEEKNKTAKKRELLEEEVTQRTEQLGEGFRLLGDALIEIVCVRLPNPKPPTLMEKELFSNALSAVTAKYAPGLIDYAPEVMLVVSLAAIVLPRLKADNIHEVKPKTIEEKKADGPDKQRTEGIADNGQDGIGKNAAGENAPPAVAPVGDA